ncbi:MULTISPECIES: PAS domain-containing protein [unclassified Halorubrum]|uniref:PAS domain-containing protein n=1 Tax=unclassified Halorubrum TaxID=2642239 RepID=UPI000B99761F|nr:MULTISPECIES: PAS domain-containing protein [unclassified Halorubrum]OYR43585.1 diguanylate cyclase [Halorubrum sp. Hd13]OYR43773.1 diguanylate cyclase [Halorubrum sp. Eb13]OYR50940.1 diguanylate cyclase [Halorubrum sp. Ea8]
MGLREAILEFLACDEASARSAFRDLLGHRPDATDGSDASARRGLDPHRLPRTRSEAALPAAIADSDDLTDRGRRLIERVRLLDDAPLGVTLCGPAYRDTPILYANRTTRELTGYSLAALRGRNPRLLQGPKTSDPAVADLREAVSIWEPVTVELWNHRRDGTPFLNRVSLRPLPGDDGTITHWVAVQEAVDGSGAGR